MILVSTNFGKPKQIYNDLRDAEKLHTKVKFPQNDYSFQLTELIKYYDYEIAIGKNKINPKKFTCTCNYYKELSDHYSGYDVKKVCNHIYSFFVKKNFKHIKNLSRIFMLNQKHFGIHNIEKVNDELYLSYKPESCWTNIHIKSGENWQQFSYSTEEKRWSNNRTPESAEIYIFEIKKYRKQTINN